MIRGKENLVTYVVAKAAALEALPGGASADRWFAKATLTNTISKNFTRNERMALKVAYPQLREYIVNGN